MELDFEENKLQLDEACHWCEDSGILLFDFDDRHTAGDDCPACNQSHGMTLEEFEEQLRGLGYSDEEISVELERIEAENENLGN